MKERIFDWTSGERLNAVDIMETVERLSSTKKIILDREQIKKIIPHRGKWLFLKEISLGRSEATTELDLLGYFTQTNKILPEKIGRIKKGKDFLDITKRITEKDCEGHFTPPRLVMPGHLILDLFEIGAMEFLPLGFHLIETRGKFSFPAKPGQEIKFVINRTTDFSFSGRAFVDGKLASEWKGSFGKEENKGIWFSPLHSVLEAMAQLAACLTLWKYWQTYGREAKEVVLRRTWAKVFRPLDAHKKIVLRVRISREKEKVGEYRLAKFEGTVENGKIEWEGEGIYYL